MSGTYIGAGLSDDSKSMITSWMAANNIPNPVDPKTFHVTIIFSRETLEDVQLGKRPVSWTCWPNSLKIFDNRQNEGKRSLVMALTAPELHDRHWHYRLAYGARHDYPEFIPHLTLSYDVPADFDARSMIMPAFKLELTEEYVSKLDDNWTGQDRRELQR